MMKVSYKLTKDETKLERFEKKLKTYIINFKTICYKLSALGNIIHSFFNYTFMRPVSNLRLPKEQKNRKKAANSWKKLSEKSVKGIEKWTF